MDFFLLFVFVNLPMVLQGMISSYGDWMIDWFPEGVWSAAETCLPWQSRNHDEGAETSVWTIPEGILQQWTFQKYSNTMNGITGITMTSSIGSVY